MAALAEERAAAAATFSLPVVFTAPERAFLASLGAPQRATVEAHVAHFASRLERHCGEKLHASGREVGSASTAAAARKVWNRAARKLRAAIEQSIAAARARVDSEREAALQRKQQRAEARRANPIYDPYAILNLELPTDASHSDEKRTPTANARPLPDPGDWSVFEDPTLPLAVDVGCGSGQWCIRAAFEEARNMNDGVPSSSSSSSSSSSNGSPHNFLGVEIREGLVRTALRFRDQVSYELDQRITFWHGAVDAAFWTQHVATYPGPIVLFCCQLPDPRLEKNMRRKGRKNRVLTRKRIVQPELANAVVGSLCGHGGIVYVSSDYEQVAWEMRAMFAQDARLKLASIEALKRLPCLPRRSDAGDDVDDMAPSAATTDVAVWLPSNPFNLPTEREIRLEKSNGRKVLRVAFECV